jgi:hypothetical protein
MAYDTVKIAVPPPGMPSDNWQTKDLENYYDRFVIAADGVMTSSGGEPYTPENSFSMIGEVDGEWVHLQADVSEGRVTKIRRL